MDMQPDELRAILDALGLTQREVAKWAGMDERTFRRYVAAPGSSGARGIHPFMALLFRLLRERPELVQVARDAATPGGKRLTQQQQATGSTAPRDQGRACHTGELPPA
jgi:hypothetical protein